MSGDFQNIDPPPPSPPSECGAGGGHTRGVERGGGSIFWFWKTPDMEEICLACYLPVWCSDLTDVVTLGTQQ
jgi:hypothetical protein